MRNEVKFEGTVARIWGNEKFINALLCNEKDGHKVFMNGKMFAKGNDEKRFAFIKESIELAHDKDTSIEVIGRLAWSKEGGTYILIDSVR